MAVGKARTANKHLPLRMYWKNGAYWFVSRENKWKRLGADYAGALRALCRLSRYGPPGPYRRPNGTI
jgi:hypothetical protein